MASDAFGTLRSLLHREQLDEASREALWELLDEAERHDPHRYRDEWVPYLETFSHHFSECVDVSDAAGLERRAMLLPFARFRLEFLFLLEQIDHAQIMRGVRALAASPSLERVTTLSFVVCPIGDEAIEILAGSAYLGACRELYLWYLTECEVDGPYDHAISQRGARALASSRALKRLEVLDLSSNPIGDDGVAALLNAPWATSLEALNLNYTRLSDRGVEVLAASPALAGLEVLHLAGYPLHSSRSRQAIMASPYLSDDVKMKCLEEVS